MFPSTPSSLLGILEGRGDFLHRRDGWRRVGKGETVREEGEGQQNRNSFPGCVQPPIRFFPTPNFPVIRTESSRLSLTEI